MKKILKTFIIMLMMERANLFVERALMMLVESLCFTLHQIVIGILQFLRMGDLQSR